jgi:hypothetical protein
MGRNRKWWWLGGGALTAVSSLLAACTSGGPGSGEALEPSSSGAGQYDYENIWEVPAGQQLKFDLPGRVSVTVNRLDVRPGSSARAWILSNAQGVSGSIEKAPPDPGSIPLSDGEQLVICARMDLRKLPEMVHGPSGQEVLIQALSPPGWPAGRPKPSAPARVCLIEPNGPDDSGWRL